MSRASISQERPSSQVNAENPWPGLAPFSEDLAAFFHGRRREVEDLFRRVRLNPLTVLYGQSGLGKTSLLQAALAPRLREADQLPVFIRIDYGDEKLSPRSQIAKAFLEAAAAVGARAEPLAESESLWEYFHRKRPCIITGEGEVLPVVLAFDQFEELFTHGAERTDGGGFVRELLDELASLVENRPSDRLQGDFERDPRRVAKYNFDRQDYRILINLREDFLAHLHDLSERIPSITINNMRLAPLDGERALEAVVKPGGALVTASVAERIVRFVAGAGEERRQGPSGTGGRSGAREVPSLTQPIESLVIDPSLLSLFCQALNRKRLASGAATISPELVSQSSEDILTEFYDSSLAGFPPATRRFVEDELLTPSGFRETLAAETARARLAALGVSGDVLDKLVEKRLLHFEQRGRDRRVELTHDVLTKVASASRESRLATERERRKVQELEEQEARARQAVREAEELARQHEEALQKARRQRRTFAVLGLVMTGLLALALVQWRRANLNAASLQASINATKAEAQRADSNAVQSQRNEIIANRNAARADSNAAVARQATRRVEAALADERRATENSNRMEKAATASADRANERLANFCSFGRTLGTRLADSVNQVPGSERLYSAVIAISDSFNKALRAKAPDELCPLQLQARFEAVGARQLYNQSRNTRLTDAKRDTLRMTAREHAFDGMRALQELDQRTDSESVSITIFAYSELANVLVNLGTYDSAARVARRGLEIAARVDPARDRMAYYRRADLARQLGTVHAIQNRQDSAHAVFLLGMSLADSGKLRPGQNREWLDYASAELEWRLAVVDTMRHRPDSALGHARRMVQEAIGQYTEDRRSEFNYAYLATSWERLGHHAWNARRFDEARAAFDSAEALRSRLAGEQSGPITAGDRDAAQLNLLQLRDSVAALEFRSGGDTARALALTRRAVALARVMAVATPPSLDRRIRLANAYGALGDAESASGHYPAAIEAYRQRVTLDSLLAVEGGFSPSDVGTLAAAYTAGANALESAGQWDEAVRWQEQALSRRAQARDSLATHGAGAGAAALATARRRQASALLSLGWFELSARRFPASIAHSTEAFALDSANTYSLPNLFNGLLLAGRGAQADSMFQVHARRQVEDPAVPFACAVVRDLETVLIPRGAARPEQLRHAEELAGRHSPSPLSQCPHRKIPPPTP